MIFKNYNLKTLVARDCRGAYPCGVGEDGGMGGHFSYGLVIGFPWGCMGEVGWGVDCYFLEVFWRYWQFHFGGGRALGYHSMGFR